jgi:hypothetical protein
MKLLFEGSVVSGGGLRFDRLGRGAFVGERRLGRPFWTMGALEPGLFGGRPCDLPGCAASADPSMSFAHRFSSLPTESEEET